MRTALQIGVSLIAAQIAVIAISLGTGLVQYREGLIGTWGPQYDINEARSPIAVVSPLTLVVWVLLIAVMGTAVVSTAKVGCTWLDRKLGESKGASRLRRFLKGLKAIAAFAISLAVGMALHVALFILAGIFLMALTRKRLDEIAFVIFNVYAPFAAGGCLLGLAKGLRHPRVVASLSAAILIAIFAYLVWYDGELSWNAAPTLLFCILGIPLAYFGCRFGEVKKKPRLTSGE